MESEAVITPPGFVELAPGTIASDYALKELNAALGKAQDEFKPAGKGETNTYVGYKYTSLADIIGAVRPALTKNHLTVSQFPVVDLENKIVNIYTRLVHWDSGEWMQNCLEVPAELALGKGGVAVFNQQTIGGSQTYAMKYAYKAIVGIPDSEEMIDSSDEKGNLDSRSKPKAQPPQRVQAAVQAQPIAEKSKGVFQLNPPNQVTCVLLNVRETITRNDDPKKQKPVVTIKFNGDLPFSTGEFTNGASTFDTGLFDALKAGLNKEVTFSYKEDGSQKFINILDVFFVDGIEFVNGKPSIEGAV